MNLVPLWFRPAHTKTTAVAEVVLLAFAPGKLDLSVPLEASEHGAVTKGSSDAVQVTSYSLALLCSWTRSV